jgi:hypothetical protein
MRFLACDPWAAGVGQWQRYAMLTERPRVVVWGCTQKPPNAATHHTPPDRFTDLVTFVQHDESATLHVQPVQQLLEARARLDQIRRLQLFLLVVLVARSAARDEQRVRAELRAGQRKT